MPQASASDTKMNGPSERGRANDRFEFGSAQTLWSHLREKEREIETETETERELFACLPFQSNASVQINELLGAVSLACNYLAFLRNSIALLERVERSERNFWFCCEPEVRKK